MAIVLNPEGHPLYVHPVDYWQLKDAFRHLAGRTLRFTTLRFDENPYHEAGKKKAGQGASRRSRPRPNPAPAP
ncbi:hypothetical protein AKL17_2p0003 (plasmid) [Frigidibacter mobilis]|uniref:Uncharacterized protein n=1 Tax=Frigidibacter mobilis TaxID=1335048 RepID=A0A159Z962_9RHOB|nr:hypothetical protein AKL17_2p0003 [Frigidibacter mobilis]